VTVNEKVPLKGKKRGRTFGEKKKGAGSNGGKNTIVQKPGKNESI